MSEGGKVIYRRGWVGVDVEHGSGSCGLGWLQGWGRSSGVGEGEDGSQGTARAALGNALGCAE